MKTTGSRITWIRAALVLGLPALLTAGALGVSYAAFGAGEGAAWLTAELSGFALWYAYLAISVGLAVAITFAVAGRLARARLRALHRDGLTGLLNRAGFSGLTTRTLRRGSPCSLALLELTGVEQLREERGRTDVRDTLRRVAETLSAKVGTAARFDTTTFGAVLPGASAEEARAIASELSDAVVETLRGIHPALGLRVGVGSITSDAGSPRALFQQAEHRLETAATLVETSPLLPLPCRPVLSRVA